MEDLEIEEPARIRNHNNNEYDDDHNVRQKREVQRISPFLERVEMLIENVQIYQGTNNMRTRQLGPNSRFISLEDYITSRGRHGTIMVCMILSISTSSNQTQVAQKSYNGVRGLMSTVCHSRKITVMCLQSGAGKNTAIILQGNGLCPRLFEDIETLDNGHICKLYLHFFYIYSSKLYKIKYFV